MRDNRLRSESPCSDAEPLRRYRVSKYRVALVREGTISTTWDKTVRESADVAAFMTPLVADLDRETFWAVMLDGRNRVIGVHVLSVGTLTSALVHPRELAKALILSNSAAAVLVHQHPSGDPAPSPEDCALTERLCAVGDLLGIRILDHIIIGQEGAYRSLADDGALRGAR